MRRPCKPRHAAALLAGLFLLTGVLLPLPWLAVSDGDDLRYVLPGLTGTTFDLRWVHSVEREAWQERFRLGLDGIRLTGSRFKTYGAGVPAGGRSRLEDGWVVLDGLDRAVAPLHVQAGRFADYRLGFGGHELSLSEAGRQPVLTFARIHAPLWRVLPPLFRYLIS